MSVSLTAASRTFNPSVPGTPNAVWETALRCMPELALPNGAIVVVSPHPDDEVLGAGGLIRAAALAGAVVTILSVTDGEAAYSDWQGLAGIRCREVSEALRALGCPNVTTQHLRIPDGHVERHRATLIDAVEEYISRGGLLVAPYERDGHPDHDATGDVCCEIASSRHVALWRYPIWMWHHGTPEAYPSRSWGRFPLDGAAMQAKTAAMACFTSQMRPLGREPIVPSHVLPYFARRYEAYLT